MSSVVIKENQSESSLRYYAEMEKLLNTVPYTPLETMQNFAKYVPTVDLGRFLAKYMIFQQVLNVHGYIIECGVFRGGGLMSWAQFSAIFEPLNHVRRIVGFDSFAGFPSVSDADRLTRQSPADKVDFRSSYEEMVEVIRLHDMYRPLGHIPRVQLIAGDALQTIPRYVETTPHLAVALLYLDFDLYEPTKLAIESFLPRMPKGAVIAFDELGLAQWPGETKAAMDTIGLRNLRLQRFPHQPQISYAVLE